MAALEVTGWVLIRRPIWDVYEYLDTIEYLPRWMPFYSRVQRTGDSDEFGRATAFNALAWTPLPYWVHIRMFNRIPGRGISYQCDLPPQTAVWELQPGPQGTIVTATHYPRLWAATSWDGALSPIQAEMLRRVLDSLKLCVERSPEPDTRHVFFCYRRAGNEYIGGRICDVLQQEFGHGSVFRDISSILGGQDAMKQVEHALKGCSVVLVAVGPRWEEQFKKRKRNGQPDWVELELAHAAEAGKRIIPLFVERDPKDDGIDLESLPETFRTAFARSQYYCIRADPDFNADMAQVVKSIWDELRARQL